MACTGGKMDWLKKDSKPLIGVTGPDRGGASAWFFTKLAVILAGGKAKRITPSRPCPIEDLDGLILGGGSDVDPELYGETLEKAVSRYNKRDTPLQKDLFLYIISLSWYPFLYLIRKLFSVKELPSIDKDRDDLEHSLMDKAIKKEIPLLGICRGAQLMNIYFGGSLYQNIREFYEEIPQIRSVLPKKHIHIETDSKLGAILRIERSRVNGLHNQAIKDVGKNINIVAKESNHIIQAIEHASLPFVIGVQWHPEYMPQERVQRSIFSALTEAARSCKSGKAEKK
jgi:putative glutamine amidotransferase